MPSAEQFPDDLKELTYRNCIELTHARWRSDVQVLTEALRRLLGESVQPQSSAAAGQGVGQGGGLQEERVARELALRIGPIASILVKRAAAQCSSLEEVCRKVAEEIDSKEEREKFLREAAAIDSSFLVRTAESAAIPAPQRLAQASEQRMTITASAAAKDVQPPRRGKYWLVIAAALVLASILLVVLRLAPMIGAGSSQPNKSAAASVTSASPLQAAQGPQQQEEAKATIPPNGL